MSTDKRFTEKTRLLRNKHTALLEQRAKALVVIESLTTINKPDISLDALIGDFLNHPGVAYTSHLDAAKFVLSKVLPEWEIDAINWVRDLAKVTIRKIKNNRVRYTARKLSRYEAITLLIATFRVYVKTVDVELEEIQKKFLTLKNTLDRAA